MWNLWHRSKPAVDETNDVALCPVSAEAVYDIRMQMPSLRHTPNLISHRTQVARPGDTISGNVILSVMRPAYMNDITVELSGKCIVKISRMSSLTSHDDRESVDLFKPRQHVLSAVPCELQPGHSYQWPFSMVLPTTTEFVLQSGAENVDRNAALHAIPIEFEDGQHPLPSSFHHPTRNHVGMKNFKSPRTISECHIVYSLSVKINRKYMPDHHTVHFPFHVWAHEHANVAAQVYRKRLSTFERPLTWRCDGTHQILRQFEVQMDVFLPTHACLPISIVMSVQPRYAMDPQTGIAPPILMSVQLQLRQCLRMRYNSGNKGSGPSKRELHTISTVVATHFIPCYQILKEQPHRVVTDFMSFIALAKGSKHGITKPVRTYTITQTYILTVTAKLRGPMHMSKECTFSQDIPWHFHWFTPPHSRLIPIAGYSDLPKFGRQPQSVVAPEPEPEPKVQKGIVSPEAEVTSGTKPSQWKTIETTITALDSQDDGISSATSSQLAFERGEEERRGLMPIYKAWWKKGIKMDDDFRHM